MNTPLLTLSDPAAQHPGTPRRLQVAGHELTVYVEFAPLLQDLLRDIAAAQDRIWIEMYIFAADNAGKAVGELLKQKAREGLDVRVMYDAVGSQGTPNAFFADLAAGGVKVHCYHSFIEGLRRFRLFHVMNRRDHRKLIVVDDFAGYFGGMNIIDNAVGNVAQARAELPRSAGWRDVHLRLSGPQQYELAESFERSWARAHKVKLVCRPRGYRRALLSNEEESIRFFDSGPGRNFSRAGRVYLRMLRHARENVTMAMAYFLPVGRVLRALLRTRRRGVCMRIITPGESDVKWVQRALTHLATRLARRGIRLYERKGRMLHSKMMVVDGTWTVVGSCNFDARSFWINLEFLAVIRSPAFAKIMLEICQYEIERSQRVKAVTHAAALGRWERFLNTVGWSLRWWL